MNITSANAQQDLTNVHAGDDAVGLAEGSSHTRLQSIGTSARQHFVDADDVVGMSANAEMETFFAGNFDQVSSLEVSLVSVVGLKHDGLPYLFAQIRAASRASELSCSYSFETMCTHSGNSSTLAFLRPRSKILILGSGTPRLNRDLGYGYPQNHQYKSLLSPCCNFPPQYI
jgi:hypothetical protein